MCAFRSTNSCIAELLVLEREFLWCFSDLSHRRQISPLMIVLSIIKESPIYEVASWCPLFDFLQNGLFLSLLLYVGILEPSVPVMQMIQNPKSDSLSMGTRLMRDRQIQCFPDNFNTGSLKSINISFFLFRKPCNLDDFLSCQSKSFPRVSVTSSLSNILPVFVELL